MRNWRRALRGLFTPGRPGGRRRTAFAVLVPVGVAGFGVGYAVGFGQSGYDRTAPDRVAATVDTEADTFTRTRAPEATAGDATDLLVGGSPEVGTAAAYLRFTVAQPSVSRARLHITVADATEGQLLEAVSVDPHWTEDGLSAAEVPPFGRPLDARTVGTGGEIVFDVSAAVTGAGTYAFAVTSPDDHLLARLKSRESATPPRLDYTVPYTPGPSGPSGTLSASGSHPGTVPPGSSPGPVVTGPGGPSSATDGPPAPNAPGPSASGESYSPFQPPGPCRLGPKLVPTCGSLLGVAPGGHDPGSPITALHRFEKRTDRRQDVYHAYHRGTELFPTGEEIALARDPAHPRILFLNWKPRVADWAEIAAGDPEVDAFLDRLAEHITRTFPEPFFFTVHHEPENDVDPEPGSGRTADDYAAMYRYVVERLRDHGATNIVSVMVYMAYIKWAVKPWHENLYPGDDVVDWVAWDAYGHSEPGEYGYGDFAELVDRTDDTDWPGYYRWAAMRHPTKPLMLAEWGVWRSAEDPDHQAEVFTKVAGQLLHFPRLKAMVYFETESDQRGNDSRVDAAPDSLSAYRDMSESRHFQVRLR